MKSKYLGSTLKRSWLAKNEKPQSTYLAHGDYRIRSGRREE
jgi:hypothetical protein